MNRKKFYYTLLVCFCLPLLSREQINIVKKQPADYINPFIGASTSEGKAGIYHGLGKTFPGAATPFGMVQVSPNTITGGDNGSGYSYENSTIEGFAFTQMSGIGWYGDLGNFLVMPTIGTLKTSAGKPEHPERGYRSRYSKKDEKASAGYYAATLTDYNIRAEMTAAPHSGILRFTFPENRQSRIQIDLARRVGGTATKEYVKVVNENTIEGWMQCTPDGGGWGDGAGKANYTVYFYAQFDKPLKDYGVWSADIPDDWSRKREDVESDRYQQKIADATVLKNAKEKEGKHIGFYTAFATSEQEKVLMKAGISFVSMDNAKENLQAEIPDWNFDKVHQQARELWNNALSKMTVQGGTEEEKTVFYTALYHAMIDPRNVQDVNKQCLDGDGKIYTTDSFSKRTFFSGWDVFRSEFPLLTIIEPKVVNDEINSLTKLAERTDSQYFSRWELLNAYTGCMLGNPAVVVLADAYAKNIRHYDVNKAYQYALNTCKKFDNGKNGYTDNSISETLEYAYDDWCLSTLAKALGKKDIVEEYFNKSKDYKNIFDASTHWFRPRDANGNWLPLPEDGRLAQGYGCVESNPYQQGWFVPQDVAGMIQLMGGKEKTIADLQNFFEKTPQDMMWNNYYNHANEPVHHAAFLFNRIGAPWLTQKWSRAICERAYHNSVEGLVGNDDVGQMSAWYVLAASGLYQLCPGDTRFEITSPVFDKMNIKTGENGANVFTVIAQKNSSENIYIQSARLNGKPYNKCCIDYKDIVAGGTLELQMGSKPNINWGAE
ncbi:alpha-1,2-mannosidase [Arachidicoccus ginsenosidimutans]|uniref:GH92 family glycosyl hydrolase n=1 Tax=Arachidicoccus sp. BS20 TaxID=1850526 RepID=UPI0007F0D552|nr:GH92 family glycosyl hydrolase [Arachidicoccus sp. BS20]ANI89649.1 alpha-1,2-mannosidase [Arachidicoccus sp. BS20]